MRQIIVTGLHFCFLNDKLFGFENENVAFPCLVCGNFNYSCLWSNKFIFANWRKIVLLCNPDLLKVHNNLLLQKFNLTHHGKQMQFWSNNNSPETEQVAQARNMNIGTVA